MITLVAQPVTTSIKKRLAERVENFVKQKKRQPSLSVVLVGNDPASVIYTTKKGEAATSLGLKHQTLVLPENSKPSEVKATIERLNQNPAVDGILLQRPLPKGFIESEVIEWIAPEKDVDAFHPLNVGRLFAGNPLFVPCTPKGVMVLLEHYGINPAGKVACVVGRSSIVGKPLTALLLQAHATTIQCHSKTPELKNLTKLAEILVVAAGKPGLIDASYVKNGAVVVDVGIHRNLQGKIVGDVKYDEVSGKVSAITPVPGGVGPMTITMLLENTILAAERREGLVQ
jgi:methylenetetrahydrofolate dehydrogenase (NADP+) / methenyltetrahydrofolate cyclohydrolase